MTSSSAHRKRVEKEVTVVAKLPVFDLGEYGMMLDRLRDAGYQFHLVTDMVLDISGQIGYLRHDLDAHIPGVDEMAMIEAERQIKATYYVALTLHYNPLYPENQRILKRIQDMGHEIGLHYDVSTYPRDSGEARKHLDWEANVLGTILGKPIRTICMHNPHKGEPDPFVELDEYVHPLDPRLNKDLIYVSDSCRAWRDESLLSCFSANAPKRLLLNTHPDSWLDGTLCDRIEYHDCVLRPNGLRQHEEYFDSMRDIWVNHVAPKLHDARETRYRSREAIPGRDNG